jgi:hypothetical protein
VLSQLRKDLVEVKNQISSLSRLDYDVVDVRLDDAPYKFPENSLHATLKHGARILEPKGHRLLATHAERSNK